MICLCIYVKSQNLKWSEYFFQFIELEVICLCLSIKSQNMKILYSSSKIVKRSLRCKFYYGFITSVSEEWLEFIDSYTNCRIMSCSRRRYIFTHTQYFTIIKYLRVHIGSCYVICFHCYNSWYSFFYAFQLGPYNNAVKCFQDGQERFLKKVYFIEKNYIQRLGHLQNLETNIMWMSNLWMTKNERYL